MKRSSINRPGEVPPNHSRGKTGSRCPGAESSQHMALPNAGLTSVHRLRRWPSNNPALGERLVFAGDQELQNRVGHLTGSKVSLWLPAGVEGRMDEFVPF